MARDGHRSLGEATYDRLVAMLCSADLPPGTRLPSETELSRQFAVSRPVLRQAMARLRTEGRVVTRKGSGTVVLARQAPLELRFGPLESIPDVEAFLEFRCSLESEIAGHAARSANRSQVGAIRQSLRTFERQLAAGAAAIEEDFAFHAAVAHATGNRFFVAALQGLRDQMFFGIRLTRELSNRPRIERFGEIRAEHGAIADAIAAGDAASAEAAMTAHLRGGVARLFGTPASASTTDGAAPALLRSRPR